MQWILGVFAQKYHRTFDLHGHVWYDRFRSKIIMILDNIYTHLFIYPIILLKQGWQDLREIIPLVVSIVFRKVFLIQWKDLQTGYLEYYGQNCTTE